MKPLFVVGGLYSEANGVARIMRDLAAALGRAGSPVTVFGARCWGKRSVDHIFTPPTVWKSSRGLWLGGLSWSPGLKGLLAKDLGQADVIHNHSIWMLPNSYGSRLAGAANKPVLITAHGALEPWSLQHSKWKKQVVGAWFQSRDIHAASCVHVNSRSELAGVREYGYKGPVAVISNGVNPTEFCELPSRSVLDDVVPGLKGKKIALFMARLHVKKGLEGLLLAWAHLHDKFPDWQLVVAGPDSGFEGRARRLVAENGMSQSVSFVGNLQGDFRLAALSAADVFVHPSYSEGFSMAILEALACGVPVLLTPGCNFPEAALAGAAIEVSPDVDGVVEGLEQLLFATDADRAVMGASARALIQSGYTWDAVAEKTSELYRWLCGASGTPAFVDVL